MKAEAVGRIIILTGCLIIISGLLFTTRGLCKEYRIQPEDILKISVWNHPDLDSEAEVDPRGVVSLPLIGEVTASGLTARQLEKKLTDLWGRDFIKNPAVRVHIEKKRFFVLGEVKNPGSYELVGRMTVLKAISMAGGFTDYAAEGSITVIRESGPTFQKLEIDLSKIKKGKARDVELRPGDVVNVPQSLF